MEIDYTQTGYDEDLVDEKVGYLADFADDQLGRIVANVAYYRARGFCIAHNELITHPSYQPSRRAKEIAEALLANLCPSDGIQTIPQMHAYYVKELKELFEWVHSKHFPLRTYFDHYVITCAIFLLLRGLP